MKKCTNKESKDDQPAVPNEQETTTSQLSEQPEPFADREEEPIATISMRQQWQESDSPAVGGTSVF